MWISEWMLTKACWLSLGLSAFWQTGAKVCLARLTKLTLDGFRVLQRHLSDEHNINMIIKCKQQKWWWENWIFEHYIWLKRSKILANQLFFSFFYIKSAVRFLIAWSWIHPGRNPMLDTCPPRQCLTLSIFELDPYYGYEFNLSHSKTFDFWGPIYDWNIFEPHPLS